MYEVVDLTEMFGERFSARDINAQGVGGGNFRLDFANAQACVVENGNLTMLPKYNGQSRYMTDLADNGDAIGGTSPFRSVFYHDGKIVDIGIPGHPKSGQIAGLGLNNLGQVVGCNPLVGRPLVWEDGEVTHLSSPPNGAAATAVQ